MNTHAQTYIQLYTCTDTIYTYTHMLIRTHTRTVTHERTNEHTRANAYKNAHVYRHSHVHGMMLQVPR